MNDWHLYPLYLPWPSRFPGPFCSPNPFPAPISPRSVFSSYLVLLRLPLLQNCLGAFPTFPVALDPLLILELRQMYTYCWAAISLLNISPWPNWMVWSLWIDRYALVSVDWVAMGRLLWIYRCGSVTVLVGCWGSVVLDSSLWFGCWGSVAVGRLLWIGLCGPVTVGWLQWVSRCGSVTVVWSLRFGCCGFVAVIWSLWFGSCGFVVVVW